MEGSSAISNLVRKEACPFPGCGSSDAFAIYDDGHGYCFSCNEFKSTEGGATPADSGSSDGVPKKGLLSVDYVSIPERKLTEETCRKWDYGIATDKFGNKVQVANYRAEDGTRVSQKLRTAKKEFTILGESKLPLFGKWLWPPNGKYVTVTEGELDALSVSQNWCHKWPVVSVPNGAASAKKAIRENLEYLNSFETVVLMFDMDEPGQKAARDCATLFKPGQVKIARLPDGLKDANEALQKGKGEALISAFWNAETFRPDGVLDSGAVLNRLKHSKSLAPVCGFFVSKLDGMTKSFRQGELITICAGTGIGKSEFIREQALYCRSRGLKIGYVALEESVERSALGLVGLQLNKPIKFDERPLDAPGFEVAWDSTIKDHFYFFDHFGSLEESNLLNRLRYLRVSCEVDVIFLDHISIVVSGMETGDERRTFDNLMTKLRSLSEETGVAIILISHLKRPASGTPLEEGGQTSLSLLRGSASIAQLSDTVIGLERDQQDEERKDITTIRLLKCRWTGHTGFAGAVSYNRETGRLVEVDKEDLEALAQNTGVDSAVTSPF